MVGEIDVGDLLGEAIIEFGDVGKDDDGEILLRYFELNQRFDPAFIVTPGDNDWLDCKRRGAGGYDEYERLDAFRRIFYPQDGYSTGGNPMAVQQQSSLDSEFIEFVENALWSRQGVLFATVHVVALTQPATDPARTITPCSLFFQQTTILGGAGCRDCVNPGYAIDVNHSKPPSAICDHHHLFASRGRSNNRPKPATWLSLFINRKQCQTRA